MQRRYLITTSNRQFARFDDHCKNWPSLVGHFYARSGLGHLPYDNTSAAKSVSAEFLSYGGEEHFDVASTDLYLLEAWPTFVTGRTTPLPQTEIRPNTTHWNGTYEGPSTCVTALARP